MLIRKCEGRKAAIHPILINQSVNPMLPLNASHSKKKGKVVLKAAEWTEQCALPAEGLSLGFVVNTLTGCLFIAQPLQHTNTFSSELS